MCHKYTEIKLSNKVRGCSDVRSEMYVYVSYTLDTILFDDQSSILLDYKLGVIRLEKVATSVELDIRRVQSIAVDYSYFHFNQPNPYMELRIKFTMVQELMFIISRFGVAPWVNCNLMDVESRVRDLCDIGFYWPEEERRFLENKRLNVPWIPVLRIWKLQVVG